MKASGTKLYLAASLVAPVSALLRNIVIARMLGPEMFGLAVTLVITAQFFDTVTNVGSDQFLVQDDEGDAPRVQAMAQLTLVLRGLLSGCLMVAVATPLALFYHQPQLALPLMLMAVIPLSNGFLHLDIRRYQKRRRFGPESKAIIAAEVSSLIAAAVFSYALHNYYAALLSLLARNLILMVMSHVVAERPYRLGYEPESGRKMVSFGWPLLLNGGLLFFGGQGDRMLIGHFMGPLELGLYSTALLLIFYPMTMVQRFLSNTHFPQIVAARGDEVELVRSEERLKGQIMLAGATAAIGFVLVAPFFLFHIYGARYAMPPMLIGLIGLLQVIRMLRVWPATIALAIGRTGIILGGNLIRMIALPLAWLGFALGYGLTGITLGLIVGEVVSIMCSLWPFASSRGRQMRAVAMTTLILATLMGEIVTLAWITTHGLTAPLVAGAVVFAGLLIFLLKTDTPLVTTLNELRASVTWKGSQG